MDEPPRDIGAHLQVVGETSRVLASFKLYNDGESKN